jgi:FKBP-type peptidyl-prolyl cis-trans isomerase
MGSRFERRLILVALALAAAGCAGQAVGAAENGRAPIASAATSEPQAAPPPATASAPALPSASAAPLAVEAKDAGATADAHDTVNEALALQARLTLVDTVVGTGREAKDGDRVTVHYVGTLADGTVFESTRAKKKPAQFVVGGEGGAVLGLSSGVSGMRVGGKRTLNVPPSLGYGRRGKGTKVPPNAPLVFDVELVSVK